MAVELHAFVIAHIHRRSGGLIWRRLGASNDFDHDIVGLATTLPHAANWAGAVGRGALQLKVRALA